MQLIQTRHAIKEHVETFLSQNEEIDREKLISKGFVVYVDNKITGCFILDHLSEHSYWLRQLYVIKEETMTLPLLIETILALAEEQGAREVCVNSNQKMVDIVLEALHFYPQEQPNVSKLQVRRAGIWWAYQLS